MKKITHFILTFFIVFSFVLSLCFTSFSLPVYASDLGQGSTSVTGETIKVLKTVFGYLDVVDGIVSAMSDDDFCSKLWNLQLRWNNVDFVPVDVFENKAEWASTCRLGGNPNVVGFETFDLMQCLEQSGYIDRPDGNYDFSNFPKLDSSTDVTSPLDGVEVKTNFSDFNPQFSILKRPSLVEQTFDNFKNSFLSFDNRLTIISSFGSDNYFNMYYSFFSPNNDVDFYGFYVTSSTNPSLQAYCHNTDNSWASIPYVPQIFAETTYNINNNRDGINKLSGNNNYFYSNRDFSDYDSSLISVYNRNGFTILPLDISYWSNIPVVIGSNASVIQNYYYWMNGSPSGQIYTTTNTINNVYSQEFIENNDWSEIYNNYVTDVSNYYSTTENITNEQFSEYINNATTITNITNNYITNNNGGSGDNDIITNSWLERIYQKLVEIKSILLGRGDPDDNSDYITDNGIKNDILHYPAADLFPDVPVEDFISDADDFTLDLFATKLSAVISEAIPFCYIYILGDIADSIKATPVAPYWEIPFQIDRIGIDENLVLDLTSSDWNNVHSVWITLFMILFISYLFYLSYRIVLLVSNLFA